MLKIQKILLILDKIEKFLCNEKIFEIFLHFIQELQKILIYQKIQFVVNLILKKFLMQKLELKNLNQFRNFHLQQEMKQEFLIKKHQFEI